MHIERDLNWPGSYNIRDLGGLPTDDGGQTVSGAILRGDAPDALTAAGWAALRDYGVRTLVDLRHGADEPRPHAAGLRTVRIALDDPADTEFWARWGAGLDCTPLYYRAFLAQFPRRVAAICAAIGAAPPGGVLLHCSSGRDRTGLITLLLLRLAGVTTAAVAEDYLRSAPRLAPAWQDLGLGDQNGKIETLLAEHGSTPRQAILDTLDGFDATGYLSGAGLDAAMLRALRGRLLGTG